MRRLMGYEEGNVKVGVERESLVDRNCGEVDGRGNIRQENEAHRKGLDLGKRFVIDNVM